MSGDLLQAEALPSDETESASPATEPAKIVVRVEQITKKYWLDSELVTALDKIDLQIEEGVFLAIAGPSGSGKSSLLNLIGCIDTPTSGNLWIDDENVADRTPDQLAALRSRSIGFIFQTFNLFPVLTAAENVEYPLLKQAEISAAARRQRVEKYLALVGLAKFAQHRPNQLSGGQRQRVAIARALVIHPRIVLADEPTANLDHRTGRKILRLMRKINRATRTTFVFSTHDQKVLDMADRRVDLEDGKIIRLGVRVDRAWKFAHERDAEGGRVDVRRRRSRSRAETGPVEAT
jgi:putative ABC transport system ATP-binding protein